MTALPFGWGQGDHDHDHDVSHYCGTTDPTLGDMQESDRVVRAWLDHHPCDFDATAIISTTSGGNLELLRNPYCDGTSRQTVPPPTRIQVKWHSIAKDDGSAAASMQQILDSVDALNVAFLHPTTGGFQFDFDIFDDYTYSQNTEWHFAHRLDLASKEALRIGDCTTLNIYSTGSFPDGPFGWGTKPFQCEEGTDDTGCVNLCIKDFPDDGVTVRYDMIAGGPMENYNEGDVLVHEVGHWLGLYHTFQHGCDTPGDFIMDTPAQEYPSWGCEEVLDTCTGKNDNPPGLDPIHNFMNLSTDPCMFEFTDGQFAFMYAQWEKYRQSVAQTTPAPTFGIPWTPFPTTPPPIQPQPLTLPPTPFFMLPLPTTLPTISPTTAVPESQPPTVSPTNVATMPPTPSPTTPQPTLLQTSPQPTAVPTTPQLTLPPPTLPPSLAPSPGIPDTIMLTTAPPSLVPTDTNVLSLFPLPTMNTLTTLINATDTPPSPVPTMMTTLPPTNVFVTTSPPTETSLVPPAQDPTVTTTLPPANATVVTPSPVTTMNTTMQPDDGQVIVLSTKEAPEPKCGTLATQNGYGGAAGQTKDCTTRRLGGRSGERNGRRGKLRGLKR